VSVASLAGEWSLEPLQLAPTALVAFLYAVRVRHLAQRGVRVAAWKPVVFALGLALVLAALVSPVDRVAGDSLLSAHMLQHVLLGDLAPLAMVAGLTGSILRPVLALPGVERLRVLAHPFVALPLWAIDLYVWHLPVLYQAALRHDSIHALEHFLFFTCGALMWAPVIEVLPAPEWFGSGAKLGYIAAVRLIETVLGNVFIWSSRVFYPFYAHADRLWGISEVKDQNIAGALMMLEGSIVTIVALAWLFLRLFAEGELRQELLERGLDPRAVRRAVRYGRGKELSQPR
jgi:cytochrome c oxidase assembly factor CtaG